MQLELAVYDLRKSDDIVTYVDDAGALISTNAGRTSHRGIEAGLHIQPLPGLEFVGSYAYAVHRFERWQPSADLDLSGKEMPVAPRSIGFVEASYQPPFLSRVTVSVEANFLGDYWMDPENTMRYDDHAVLGLRGSIDLPAGFSAFGRITNLTDRLYAEQATYNAFRGEEFAPAQPRAVFLGVRYGLNGEGEAR